jgi:hypothetical protein
MGSPSWKGSREEESGESFLIGLHRKRVKKGKGKNEMSSRIGGISGQEERKISRERVTHESHEES